MRSAFEVCRQGGILARPGGSSAPSVVRIPQTRRVHDSQRDFVKLLLRNFIRSRLQLVSLRCIAMQLIGAGREARQGA